MRNYGQLDLTKIRESCGLDFARYTFGKGQCSCCFGPLDMSREFWHDGKVCKDDDFSYILFKNAYNVGGRIKSKNEVIKDYTCIMYRFKGIEQKEQFCKELAEQLDSDYVLVMPKGDAECIIIYTAKSIKDRKLVEDDEHVFFYGSNQG